MAAIAAARRQWQLGSRAAVQWTARRRQRQRQHLAGSVAAAAAPTINNQLKVSTAAATETAMMTVTMMTMETKVTAASCCCLHHRHCQRRSIAMLPPPPLLLPSWPPLPSFTFGRMAGDDKEGSGRRNQQPTIASALVLSESTVGASITYHSTNPIPTILCLTPIISRCG